MLGNDASGMQGELREHHPNYAAVDDNSHVEERSWHMTVVYQSAWCGIFETAG